MILYIIIIILTRKNITYSLHKRVIRWIDWLGGNKFKINLNENATSIAIQLKFFLYYLHFIGGPFSAFNASSIEISSEKIRRTVAWLNDWSTCLDLNEIWPF